MDVNSFLSSPIGLIAIAAAAFLIGSMIFNVKQWESHWKQSAIDGANAMSKAGLIHTPKILSALGVGDLAGAFREVKNLIDIFKDPAQLKAEFATVFKSILTAMLADPVEAKNLQQLANDAVAAFASGNPTAAAPQLAQDAQTLLAGNPMFSSLAQNGLQLPTLQLLPQLASNPALAGIATVLNSAGLGHLLPAVLAGAQTNAAASSPVAGTLATLAPAPGVSVGALDAGHTVTVTGPTSTPPAPAA